ncbi:MAG: histidinol dehydrogenase [Solirubrobacteraceae bacterium]
MQCERLTASDGDPAALAAQLRALVPRGASVSDRVAEIIGQVRSEGDAALLGYTRRFDTGGAEPSALEVPAADLDVALSTLDAAVRTGLERAIDNVGAVARAGLRDEITVVDFEGHQVLLREVAVRRAGIYVPGGRAPYPSTVVMGVVTARIAGVPDVAVCAPPGASGEVDATVLAACRLAGATRVYAIGGAQAIAALAYGTETVGAVDVIVGPGNVYVQEAKRQVSGDVGIDGFAGPSDLFVIAGSGADAHQVELDLLAQAEHGPGTVVVAASPMRDLLDDLGSRLARAQDTGALARLVDVRDVREGLALAQEFAPEHLELVGPDAEALAPEATRAGCVLVGGPSATAFGDYIAGSNHILPTGGAARFSSGLSPAHFRRRFSEVRIGGGAGELARLAAPIARAEGFEQHARSMEARIRDNGQG